MPIRRTLALLLLLGAPLSAQQVSDKVLERYRQVLQTNPAEGVALDRLLKAYADKGQTAELIAEYRAGGTFASEMVLGHLLKRSGQLDEAREAYQRAAKLDAANPLPALALGTLEAAATQPRESASWFEKAIPLLPENDPRRAEVLMQLGAQWLALGDPAKAAEAWEKIVAQRPDDLELRRRLADTYAQNHLTDRALVHLNFLEAKAPPADRAQALQQIARLKQGAGDQAGAIRALEKALALTTPGNWLRGELQSQLIRLHQRYHRTAELEERWKKYAEENPRDLTGYLQLIDFYERLGDLEHQRVWLERLTQLAPKNPDYRLRLARLLVQMEQAEAAIPVYDALVKEQPSNPDYVFERSRIDVQRDATAAARERIAKLLELRRTDETIRAKALEFYEQNHLAEDVEKHLIADAAGGAEEPVFALATFYFNQKREADAIRVLERMIKPADAPEKQAAAHAKIAQALKAQNRLGAALTEADKALQLQPRARDLHLLKGELLVAQNQPMAAQPSYEAALGLSTTPEQQLEADQKLFETFRTVAPEPPEMRSGVLTLSVPGMEPPRAQNGPLDRFITGLEQTAQQANTEAAWLRVARWRIWNRDRSAQAALDRAVRANPASVAAYELMVKLATLDGPTPAAVFHLMKLVEVDPANRANYLRRAGQIELQAGRVTEALATFERVLADNPGDLDALTDLALTQQRAERWNEALETWRRIYALSPASRKKDAFTPLLRVLERLELHQQAAELQLKAIDSEGNEREQFQLFTDLLATCSQHGLLDWLRGQFEQRRKLRADDYFTEMALGRILKVAGNKAAAFEVLADASYAAPNQAEALPELIREAEELRKLEAAIKLQAQLLRIAPQVGPEGLEKLAQLQEKNFELEDAARTWERIVARFPRDAQTLSRAVDFQLRWGTPARAAELLQRVRALEPANLKTLSTLASLHLEAGRTAEAEECLERLLREAPPEPAGRPLRFPALKPEDAGRLQTSYLTTVRQRRGRASTEAMRALRSFWVEEATQQTADQSLRFEAIRQLGQLVRDRDNPAALRAWVERWRTNGSASESLWALYYAGAGEALLDRLEGLMASAPGDAKIPQAYIWLALQTGQFARLSSWLQDRRRTATERDYLLIALDQYLATNEGRIEPAVLDQLFPSGFTIRLWQTAIRFAARNHFVEAAQLGQRVFAASTTQRSMVGRELAHWYLWLGKADAARATLRTAMAGGGESFEADAYGAMREYYLLLPEAERAEFVESQLASIDPEHQPLRRALTGTLLRALSGDEKAARKHLDELFRLRPLAPTQPDEPSNPATRRWRLLLTGGAQLQLWHFEKLAEYLWDKALRDEALISLQGDQAGELIREVRQRLYSLRVARATNPGEMQQWIDAYARISPRDGLLPLGESLEVLGAYSRAIEVYRQIWDRDPSNQQTLRSLLTACRSGNDHESAEAALAKCASIGATRVNDAIHRDLMMQLADLLERKGDLDRARAVLGETVEQAPSDTRLLLRLAQLHERAHQPDLAEAVYRRLLTIEPLNGSAKVGLSLLLEKHGKRDAALALLARGGSPDVEARLAQLQFAAGQIDEAIGTIERITPPQHITPTLVIVDALVARGDRKLARSVTQAALSRTTDSGLSFPLLCKAVELLAPEDGPAAARLSLRRVRQVAGEQGSLLGSYLDFAQGQAARLGLEKEFLAELNTLWAEGSGPIAAGAVLLAAELKSDPKAADETLAQLLTRDDAGEVWLYRIASVLDAVPRKDLAARVREKLAHTNPQSDQLALDWVRALHETGQPAEMQKALADLIARAAISEDLPGKLAQVCVEVGQPDAARRLFAQAQRGDPYVRNYGTYLDHARFQIRNGQLSEARETLRTAYSNPACRDFAPLVEWLSAAARLDRATAEVADFALSATRVVELQRALLAHFTLARNLPAATQLVSAQPELLTSAAAEGLRRLAREAQRFEEVAAIFELELKQPRAGVQVSGEYARLLGDWAAVDLAAGRVDPAVVRLKRAHELQPGLFEVARDLAVVLSQNGSPQPAMETLESFLAASGNTDEAAKARELLAKLKAGGTL